MLDNTLATLDLLVAASGDCAGQYQYWHLSHHQRERGVGLSGLSSTLERITERKIQATRQTLISWDVDRIYATENRAIIGDAIQIIKIAM
ncbi:MAG: hypothetical protein ACRDL7_12975 [Gaiellaceae bacterium]